MLKQRFGKSHTSQTFDKLQFGKFSTFLCDLSKIPFCIFFGRNVFGKSHGTGFFNTVPMSSSFVLIESNAEFEICKGQLLVN